LRCKDNKNVLSDSFVVGFFLKKTPVFFLKKQLRQISTIERSLKKEFYSNTLSNK